VQAACRVLPVSIRTKDRWNAADRPHYLAGVLYAAQQAQREGVEAISVVEFGVAEGYGLLALQALEETGIDRGLGCRPGAVLGLEVFEGLLHQVLASGWRLG
jgi:hypothetical protein